MSLIERMVDSIWTWFTLAWVGGFLMGGGIVWLAVT